jgi:ABC-type Fe3+/spermidine/putrescine transport system ATPase subunit
MHQGKIDADGAPQQLFERPQSAFVARFFSGMNVLPGAALGESAALVAVSPQTLLFSTPPEPHARLCASITDSLFLGEKRALVLSVEGLAEPLHAQVAARAEVPQIGRTTEIYVRRVDIIELGR